LSDEIVIVVGAGSPGSQPASELDIHRGIRMVVGFIASPWLQSPDRATPPLLRAMIPVLRGILPFEKLRSARHPRQSVSSM
jgi:hypothetical protein